jgi:phage-related protein
MEKYFVYYYTSSSGRKIIVDYINNLDIKTQERIRNILKALSEYGLSLLRTTLLKKIYKNPPIFELRITNKPQIRILFTPYGQNSFVVCHIFIKKTQKTPKREIEIAVKRAKEFTT